jgi:hypothetical protein
VTPLDALTEGMRVRVAPGGPEAAAAPAAERVGS